MRAHGLCLYRFQEASTLLYGLAAVRNDVLRTVADETEIGFRRTEVKAVLLKRYSSRWDLNHACVWTLRKSMLRVLRVRQWFFVRYLFVSPDGRQLRYRLYGQSHELDYRS